MTERLGLIVWLSQVEHRDMTNIHLHRGDFNNGDVADLDFVGDNCPILSRHWSGSRQQKPAPLPFNAISDAARTVACDVWSRQAAHGNRPPAERGTAPAADNTS